MATGIPESAIEEIKARTDIADLISSYGVVVKRAGSSMKACCPFHNEKTPSFNINVSKGFYHCFGCNESGDAIKFVQKMEGLSFMEAAKKLAAQCGVRIEEREDPEAGLRKRLYALMAELAEFYRRCLVKTKEAAVARDYLAKREIDERTQEDFLIGYAPAGASVMATWAEKHGYTMSELEAAGVVVAPKGPGDRGYHRFGGRLMFAVKDRQGRVVAFSGRQLVERKNSGKYVNSPETVIFKKSKVLFGFDRAAAAIAKSPHHEVICCEGQIDTIRLHICGFTTAVASQGTAFTEEHAKMVKRVADAAVLMYDDDAAGHKATVKVARMLLAMEMPVRVVSLPDGDDPDSFLRKRGADALRPLIDGAESVVAFQCRAEMAKEANPKSIDAVSRVTRAVVETVAACPSAVLRASMADEAARILGLPVAAVNEEVEKARAAAKAAPRPASAPEEPEITEEPESPDGAESADSIPGEAARASEPPPALEREFMEFLMANEYDRGLDAMAGEFLPDGLFAHDFTRRFAAAWRDEAVSGEDRFAEFADALGEEERGWFDGILLAAGRSQSCGMDASDVMQDFVRALWCERLRRERGALPADGGPETDARRLKLSMDLKRLQHVRWSAAKDIIRDLSR
ncbi:MAG: DNA primase [Kiritimatiellae bacterium]|nr:DNA primase [Kiritimatiellia bacterium]